MTAGSHPISMVAPVRDARTYRGLLFLLTGLPLAIAAFTVLVTGWALVAGLAIVTPVAVLVLIGLRLAVGALAMAESFLARKLLGTTTSPAFGWSEGGGFWSRGLNVLLGPAFWKQQAYLLLRVALGFPTAVLELGLISIALQALAAPLTYRWDQIEVATWTVDTLGEALLLVPLAPLALLTAILLVRPLTAPWRAWAPRLLGEEPGGALGVPRMTRGDRVRALTFCAGLTAGICLLLVAIWALTGGGPFWPIWAILPLSLLLGMYAWVEAVLLRPEVRRRAGGSAALALSIGIAGLIGAFLVAVWALTTPGGYFWPAWALLGLAIAVGIVAVGVLVHRQYRRAHRIDELETTRAGAVSAQETELRRIERDLHDGAQARLIALGMSIGMAEEKLASDPESARALLVEARSGAREALEELRDLARGIHPPILTDRGLEPAIAVLAGRAPVSVVLAVDVPKRPEPAVETAAYFVVAEALANAIKHAEATRVDITVRSSDGRLVAEIVDDGRGGADPAGRGLTGLRQRVGALDGTLRVESPAGGPTSVRAELPCA
jgi:signal transduction histidine kinase